MKKIITLLLLPLSLTAFSQEREAAILFNDSTSIKGFAEIKKEKIYFRVDLTSIITEWSYDMAYGLIFTGYGFSEKYIYIKPSKNSKKKIIVEVIEEGNVSLYKKTSFTVEVIPHKVSDPAFLSGKATIKDYDSSNYYVKRKNEEYAIDIPSIGFKMVSEKYFSDCDMLVQKIKKREFKKEDILEIVYYYNDYCGNEN